MASFASPVHFLYPPRTLLFVSKREPIEALADGFDPREPQHASFEGGSASGKEGALVHSVHCEPPDAPETRKATRFTGARRASPTRGADGYAYEAGSARGVEHEEAWLTLAGFLLAPASDLSFFWSTAWPDLIVGLGIGVMNADAAREVWIAAQQEHRAVA